MKFSHLFVRPTHSIVMSMLNKKKLYKKQNQQKDSLQKGAKCEEFSGRGGTLWKGTKLIAEGLAGSFTRIKNIFHFPHQHFTKK